MKSIQITRRQFIKTSALGLGALSLGMGCRKSDREGKKPNIILFQTDDQRWDALGCAGNPIIQTPNMDLLASKGLRFAKAFATTPICAASRASLFTGLYERTHGYTFTKPPLDRSLTDISYPLLLRQAGLISRSVSVRSMPSRNWIVASTPGDATPGAVMIA